MSSSSGGEKKHLPSERRLRKAREEGQVPKSRDLVSAALLLASVGVLWFLGDNTVKSLAAVMTKKLTRFDVAATGPGDAHREVLSGAIHVAAATVPIMASLFIAAILLNLFQTGILIAPAGLMPKFKHISPIEGVKRLVSLRGLARLVFGMFKVAIVGVVTYVVLSRESDSLVGLMALSVPQICVVMFRTIINVILWIAVALFVLGLAEYLFQRQQFTKSMMMTDQEMRDEMKESEGDPQQNARRKQIHRQMVMNRAESDVPKADVVVSNPTELAIAIQYDAMTMPAPIVLAKGSGFLAQRIRRIALANGVPVVERKPLAQTLYKTVEVGESIPPDQYQAVAEVLRYVYQLQGKELPKAAG